MNSDQIFTTLRTIGVGLLTFAAGKGWISGDDVVTLSPILGAAALLVFEWWRRRSAAKVLDAKAVPGVVNIDVDTKAASPAVAALANSKKPENATINPV